MISLAEPHNVQMTGHFVSSHCSFIQNHGMESVQCLIHKGCGRGFGSGTADDNCANFLKYSKPVIHINLCKALSRVVLEVCDSFLALVHLQPRKIFTACCSAVVQMEREVVMLTLL
jgi:hypothetical protein